MAAAATQPDHGRAVRRQRDEPPSGGPRPDGVDAPDRERRPADPRDGDRRRAEGARGVRHRVPRRRRSASPGSRRRSPSSGPCGPAARSPGRRRTTRSTTRTPSPSRRPPPPIIIGGETPAGARLAGRIGDGWSAVRRQLRAEPAALPRGARGGRPAARGPARPRRVPGRLARRRGRSRETGRGAASRARRGSAGTRPAPTGRSSSPARPTTSTRSSTPSTAGKSATIGTVGRDRSVAPSTDDRPPPPRPPRRARPIPAPAAARRSPSTSGCASAATRSGCKDAASSQVHGTVFLAVGFAIAALAIAAHLAVARDRAVRGARSPTWRRARRRRRRRDDRVTNEGTTAGSATCRISDPRRPRDQPLDVVYSPRSRRGATIDVRPRDRRSAASSTGSSPDCDGAVTDSAPRRDAGGELVGLGDGARVRDRHGRARPARS